MMKKLAISIGITLLYSPQVLAQIGINTTSPKATLHIDGKSDNGTSNSLSVPQQQNDLVITSKGNTGLGTISPNYKLEINTGGNMSSPISGFKLNDGSQLGGYVLSSDASGGVKWKAVSVDYYVKNPIGIDRYFLPANTSVTQYTGVSITIPPGNWRLSFVILIRTAPSISYTTGSQFPRLRLKDNVTDTSVTTFSADSVQPRLASGSFSNSQDFGVLVGNLGIKNSSNAPKTYYLHCDNIFSTGGSKRLEFVFDNWNETLISYMRVK